MTGFLAVNKLLLHVKLQVANTQLDTEPQVQGQQAPRIMPPTLCCHRWLHESCRFCADTGGYDCRHKLSQLRSSAHTIQTRGQLPNVFHFETDARRNQHRHHQGCS